MIEASNRRWTRMHEKTKPDLYDRLPTDGTRIWAVAAEHAPDETDFLGLSSVREGLEGLRAPGTAPD